VLTEASAWWLWSSTALRQAADRATLIINPVIYAETSVRFSRIEELDAVLSAAGLSREAIPYAAAFMAGKVFVDYRRRGGLGRSPLPDFFIGAHAAVAGYELLTRDAARYRTYFPTVRLLAPN
jgi:predicted nucleic acid-binding protein